MSRPKRVVKRIDRDAEATTAELERYRKEAIEAARGLMREVVADDTVEFAFIALRDISETDYQARVVMTCSSESMTAWFDALSDVAQTIGETDQNKAVAYFVAKILQMTERLEGEEGEQEEGQMPDWFRL